MGGDQLFSDAEAEQILQRAAKGISGGISEERLVQMADELGISREAVQAAAQDVRSESQELADRREFAVYKRRTLVNHVTSYVCTNAGLMGLNYVDEHRITWAWYVVAAWGIGILSHLRETFAKGTKDYEKEFRKWREKRGVSRSLGAPVTIGIQVNPAGKTSDRKVIGIEATISGRPKTPTQTDVLLRLAEAEALRENLTKIELIRRVREQTGVSLLEAKNAVEAFDRENPGILWA